MALLAAYVVPHPPLIVPAVGRGQEAAIADTIAAYREVARRVAAHRPDLIVITSPHAPLYRDGFFIADTPEETGSLAAFGQPGERVTTRTDLPFAEDVAARLHRRSIPSAGAPASMADIDHATFVPLHFLEETIDLGSVAVVRMGLSGLSEADHRFLGRAIAEAARALGRRCVLVASGDMSHKLKEDGPYGFAPEGPEFDRTVTGLFARGDLEGLFGLDAALCDGAAECGLRSFQIMAGALEAAGEPFSSELLSYEGPFGVGYAVAAFEIEDAPESTEEETASEIVRKEDRAKSATRVSVEDAAWPPRAGDDPIVTLARASVESIVGRGTVLPLPADTPEELTGRRAGAFVSLHEHGQLRGCIGTIAPVRKSLAEEVIRNGVAAATEDPRFAPVRPEELPFLEYSVDVLGESEPVDNLEELDPARYGVIVTRGHRRGLLLPDLEGVDTVFDQIAIAKQKAGIRPDEQVHLERFEVVRHTAGGEPRRS
ncbi:AmmeMemoRadiSam system protein A [Adlercreutzia rubneri]